MPWKKTILTSLLLSLTLSPLSSFAANINPHFLVSDEEAFDIHGMTLGQVQSFLSSRGSLGTYLTHDRDGAIRPASEIIHRYSTQFGLNPKFILALLQREQSLIEDPNPSEDQFRWAMGYAICDSCSKSDPRLQKFGGFANQVYFASKRIKESYLHDLATKGHTISYIGPNIPVEINGIRIVPVNNATSILYTYTPHLHGNKNFVKIWNRWFKPDYPHGTLLHNLDDDSHWVIHFDSKRQITSRAALHSRFDTRSILPVTSAQLEKYELGPRIHFPNYTLLRRDDGAIFLIVDDTMRGITSMETFRQLGFNPDEIIDVEREDLAGYKEGLPIAAKTAYPKGALLKDPSSPSVYFVEHSIKHPIRSMEILEENYPNLRILPSSKDELETFNLGNPIGFPDGTLIGVPGWSEIYVISNGMKRHIADEATFLTHGWKWDQIVWTNEASANVHEKGEEYRIEVEEEDLEEVIVASNSL